MKILSGQVWRCEAQDGCGEILIDKQHYHSSSVPFAGLQLYTVSFMCPKFIITKGIFSVCAPPPPSTLCSPQLQITFHYIVNHYVKILHVHLGVENNMHLLSWGGGTNGKDPTKVIEKGQNHELQTVFLVYFFRITKFSTISFCNEKFKRGAAFQKFILCTIVMKSKLIIL